MEQRDYLLDEIGKFGRMILGLIGKLRDGRASGQYEFNMSMVDLELEGESGFTLKMLIAMNESSLEAFLANHRELDDANTELLAELLMEVADDPGVDATAALARARDLLRMVDQRTRTWSADRTSRIDYINSRIGLS